MSSLPILHSFVYILPDTSKVEEKPLSLSLCPRHLGLIIIRHLSTPLLGRIISFVGPALFLTWLHGAVLGQDGAYICPEMAGQKELGMCILSAWLEDLELCNEMLELKGCTLLL